MEDKKVNTAIKWFKENEPLYTSLASKAADIIAENLKQKDLPYHSVTKRGKSIESFSKKAKSERYVDPINEIHDMAGIRVITYLESDVKKVANIIEKLFDIDQANSIDQSQLLGSDRLGYRSIHYVAKFNKRRCRLPEYKKYENLPFEIQIRSLLQHAWAEIEHDRNYKFSGKLPTELERRFYLAAGMLECVDREFVSIAEEIEKYKKDVVEELSKGDLDIEINTASLKEYLSNKFSELIKNDLLIPKFGKEGNRDKLIVEEVRLFGISKLNELDKIIPNNYESNMMELGIKNNFAGAIRDILMINDIEKYFKLSWRESWSSYNQNDLKTLAKYNVNTAPLRKNLIHT